MKTLNLTNQNNSDIKYKINKFPDGQQNIVIGSISYLPAEFIKEKQITNNGIQIKSRLNDFKDLELIICAVASLKELGVKEIHLYVPYITGARSDRKFEEGGNNYLKDVICPIINNLGFESVTCIDPHSDVLEACIKGFKKISNENIVRFFYQQLEMQQRDGCSIKSAESFCNETILISPDAGASKKIYKLAEQIGYKGDIITCSKDRDENGKLTKCIVPLNIPYGDFLDKDLIIIDDICDGGATFINIAKEIKSHKQFVGKLYLIVTHGIFSKGFKELAEYFDGIYCTNSYQDINIEQQSGYLHKMEKGKSLVKQMDVF